MRYATVCSGIDAPALAWNPLGWQQVFSSEVERFPCEVLAHHNPDAPNLGDMTKWRDWPVDLLANVDVICGGTPCQSFSVAGKRGGLADDRGNLALQFSELCNAIDDIRCDRGKPPIIVVWENVPGVFSDKDNAYGCVLAGFCGSSSPISPPKRRGWTCAGVVSGPKRTAVWRVLDAQYFGLAQRRKRVFVVASAGNRDRIPEVLLEFEGVRRDFAPSRGSEESVAGTLDAGIGRRRGSGMNPNQIAPALTGNPYGDHESREGLLVAHTLRGEGFDASEDGTGRGTPLVPVHCPDVSPALKARDCKGPLSDGDGAPILTFSCKDYGADATNDLAPTLRAMGHDGSHANGGGQLAVTTLAIRGRDGNCNLETRTDGTANAVLTPCGGRAGIGVGAIHHDMVVRRITPGECETLQGFPQGFTKIPRNGTPASKCADGPRYKALGNSMAVPVMRWIGERIMIIDQKRSTP